MKKILSFLIIMLAAVISFGQTPAPGIFNYQGVARNSVGNALVNKTINLRLTIHDGAAAGPVVYQESRLATTNPFGLFNVQVGSPGFLTQVGSVAAVNWGVNSKFIQVEIDPNGGTSFINVGTAQIASVPYALYSSLSNDLVLPFIKTQSAPASTLIGITNSATTGSQGAIMGTSASTDANAFAITGTISSAAPGGFSTGVRGINNGTGGLGIGVWGSQNGSGWGVYGTSVSGIGGNFSGGNGTGVFGSATTGTGGRFTSTTGLALHTSGGGVRLQNINEAPNRILATIPGNGDATWQDPSAVGIITGSGTLNFVSKWTPNGTTLGNSQIFDNGTNIGIGTITPTAKFSINELFKVTATGTVQYANSVNPMMIMFESGTANADRMVIGHSPAFPTWGLQYQDPPDKFNFLSGGTAVLTADLGTQRVGVGTSSPLQKLHVNSGTSFSTQLLEARDAANAGPHLQFLSGGESGFIDFIRSDYSTGGLAHRQGAMEMRGGTRLNFHPNVGLIGASDLAMTIISNNNVGIGITTPTSKLHIVNNSAAALNSVFVNQTGAGNVLNALNVFEANTSNGAYGNAAIQAIRGGGSLGNTFLWGAVTALEGIAATGGQGFGVQGTTEAGVGVAGLATNGTGVLGTNTNTGSAGHFENFFNTSNASPVVEVINISTVGSAFGVRSTISSTTPGGFSAAVRGQNNGTGGLGIGVWGSQYGAGWGMLGETVDGVGVYGASYNTGTAVNAWSSGGIGVYGRSDNNIPGYFQNLNPANGYPTLFSTTNGGGVAVQGSTSGTSSAGWFDIFNPASTASAVYGATDGLGNAGFFWNINAANAISTVRAVNPSANINAIGVHAISGGGSGYGPLFASGMIAESFSQRGILGVSNANIAVHGASNTSIGVLGESYASTGNAGVFGSGLAVNNYGVVGNAAAGTGAGGYFTGGSTALRTLGGVQLTGIGEAPNRILATVPGTGQATWEDPAGLLGSLFWSTTGNAGTVDGTNFIGTTDAVPFNIRVVNTEAGRIDLNANTSYGLFSLNASTNAVLYNTAFGYNSLPLTTTGDQNVGVGVQASFANSTGSANTSIGVGTNQSNITGFQNTALGNFAMWQNLSSENTALGTQSLNNNTTGSQNTGVGQYALAFNDNGNGNTALGYFATVTAPGLNNATAIGANAQVSASNSMVLGNNANVGIGVSAPVNKLEVLQTGAAGSAINALNNNIANVGNAVHVVNDNATAGPTSPANGGGSAIFARKGAPLSSVLLNPSAIYATSSSPVTNIGIVGMTDNSYAIVGGVIQPGGIGVHGQTFTAGATALQGFAGAGSVALRTSGAVQLTAIGEANGYVLTSDAVGNATWQDLGNAGIALRTFSAALTIPSSVMTPITQWNTIFFEDGGSNYNSITGEYTIPVTGLYQVEGSVGWNPFTAPAGIVIMELRRNGGLEYQTLGDGVTGSIKPTQLSYTQRFNAGDLLSLNLFQDSGVNQTLPAGPFGQRFSVNFIRK